MSILKLLNSSLEKTSKIFCSRSTIKKSDFVTLLSAAMPKKPEETHKSFCTPSVSNVSVNQVCLEVIGTGADGAPASVALVTNYGRYIVNCGEGTIRLSNEYKVKLHKSPQVFITYPSWKNISGLFGLALAVQESKGTELHIHSDRDVESVFSVVNKFVNLRHLQVKIKNCSHYKEYSDGTLSVKYVFLYPSWARGSKTSTASSDSECGSERETESDSSDFTLFKKKDSDTNKSFGKSYSIGSQTHKRRCMDYAVSYIFKTEGSQGSLNFIKCIELGVPPGPLLGKLKNGMDVTLDNGAIIRSADVKNPDLPGVTVIAVECPSEEYLDSLLEEPAFSELQSENTAAEAVIHFSSSDVIKNSKYQEWLSKFPKSTLHLFINEENKRGGSVAIHRQQYKLNLLHPELFPLLDDAGIPVHPRSDDCIPSGHVKVLENSPCSAIIPIYRDTQLLKCEENSFIAGETLSEIRLKPKTGYDYTRIIVLKKEEFFNEMFESDEITEKIEKSKQELKQVEQKITSDKVYPKIVFLGTGSSKPSKQRNGSGILIFVSNVKSILLDCGEATYGQLISLYGKSKAREILRNLQGIYISHMHLDHHMGLITLLKERKLAFECNSEPNEEGGKYLNKSFTPIFILAPVQILKLLDLYHEKFEDISDLYELIPNSYLLHNSKKVSQKTTQFKDSLGLSSIKTVLAAHCPNSFGVAMIHKKGWKITYSGDTKPCQALVEIGLHSDVLIHEATLEDAYENEARLKLHSTTSQAIDVGKKMKAKYILLTHFSQRYCHLPNIDSSFSNLNIGIAFDFMEVPFNKLPLLPALIKPLQFALSKYDELNKVTTESLLLKRERKKHVPIEFSNLPELMGTPAKISKRDF